MDQIERAISYEPLNTASGTRPTHLDALGIFDHLTTMPTKQKRPTVAAGVSAYTNIQTPGSLRGMEQYARVQGLMWIEALDELRGKLAYTLHRPVHNHFPTLPILVFHVDEQ